MIIWLVKNENELNGELSGKFSHDYIVWINSLHTNENILHLANFTISVLKDV